MTTVYSFRDYRVAFGVVIADVQVHNQNKTRLYSQTTFASGFNQYVPLFLVLLSFQSIQEEGDLLPQLPHVARRISLF
jgi:hypothetical protein